MKRTSLPLPKQFLLQRILVPIGTSDLGRCPTESAKWAKADLDQVAVTNRDFMSTRLSSAVLPEPLFTSTHTDLQAATGAPAGGHIPVKPAARNCITC
jgi:hypothetical protein